MPRATKTEDIFSVIDDLRQKIARLELDTPEESMDIGTNGSSYATGWSARGGGWITPNFYRDRGRTYLAGQVTKSSDAVNGESILSLPEGYGPVDDEGFIVRAHSSSTGVGMAYIQLRPGEDDVRFLDADTTLTGTFFLSLSGISFRHR